EYEVIEKGSSGFIGIGSKPAKINARVKEEEVIVVSEAPADIEAVIVEFLSKVFAAMNLTVKINVNITEESVDVDLVGDDMGVLIGKRGQTLDSLQYLVSLVVNKKSDKYLRVKLDTENYRERRKETLENLAKNIAFKVKRTKRPVSLEPMNPYERRVIHSALQNDRYVTTKSEGEEPFRHVVVLLKK
ncbi:MAG: protein jag, partial [Lachnospiraceae bacterium]|nr:protein jag [Lachnospiraceae bacterium]